MSRDRDIGGIQAYLRLLAGLVTSKLSGVLKELVIAAAFGTSGIAAAYRISQSSFYQPIQALTGDTLGAALIPLYQRVRRSDPAQAEVIAFIALAHALAIGLLLGGALFWFCGPLASAIAPGAVPEVLSDASGMIAILAFAVPAYILANSIGSLETAYGSFNAIAFRPTILNIGAIGGAAIAFLTGTPMWLAYSMLIVHATFLLWTIAAYLKLGLRLPPLADVARYGRPSLFALWRSMGPLLALPILAQTTLFVERVIASRQGTDIIPALEYARVLSDTILSLSAAPLGIVLMASKKAGDSDSVRKSAFSISSMLLLVTLPLSGFLLGNAFDVVRVLYGRGAFNETSVWATGTVLIGNSLFLSGTVTGYYLVKVLNTSLRNIETVIITALGCGANMLVDVTLWHRFGPLTLGLGASLNGLIVFSACASRLGLWRELSALILCLIAGDLVMIGVGLVVPPTGSPLLNLIIHGLAAVLVWLATYYVAPPVRKAATPLVNRMMPIVQKIIGRST